MVLLPFGLVYLLDTLGWRFAFGDEGVPGVGFGTLARIRWAGESINTVLPSAYIGGEAVKVQLLHKRGVPRVHSASSVVAGKTAQVVAQVMFIAAGAVAGAAILPPESPARAGMLDDHRAGGRHRGVAYLASATRDVSHPHRSLARACFDEASGESATAG